MKNPTSSPNQRRRRKWRWAVLAPMAIALVILAEVFLLGGLDLGSRTYSSLSDSLQAYRFTDVHTCETLLETQDNVAYSRDFRTDPVLVATTQQEQEEWSSCSVGCRFGIGLDKIADATFGVPPYENTDRILRSMESSEYYIENKIDVARGRGFNIIMTTSLSSDVPVGYFSWAEYDIMAPVQPKTEKALAAAFISNCNGNNFRLNALERLIKAGIKIDSYGACHNNRDGNVDKVETLKRYKFSLAFENSNEEDYVTEKFFQSLVAGAVPVVVGAPNIHDYKPGHGSIMHIRSLDDVPTVAKIMTFLDQNPEAFNQTLRWKYEGPLDSFKALFDMSTVHSSCRLCIHIATKLREKEEKLLKFQKRPCKCRSNRGILYHLFVRERGRFEMVSVFLSDLKMAAMKDAVLDKFKLLNHTPIWKDQRPEKIRGDNKLKIYKIYPVGITQQQALYDNKFNRDSDFANYVKSNPCAKFEVIFV
ncbi:Glycoprotein 3-alpha-L-fucosyltransferase [Rhynchospora pubera]|uniref:Fucosyltransferase n=1 Tax=Rhynchospora pubera TaxID=906938 RepID=A0AAV8DL36_9POAL|nr:Glycoprotein 3-alpha-L-fucosyltransferase [Rhynchospora pubera]